MADRDFGFLFVCYTVKYITFVCFMVYNIFTELIGHADVALVVSLFNRLEMNLIDINLESIQKAINGAMHWELVMCL